MTITLAKAGDLPPGSCEESRLDGGIFYRHWVSEQPQRAVILLAHGLGEHSGRYAAFAEFFCSRGIAVVAPDHRGHGQSPGHRSHIDRFDDFFTPLMTLRNAIADSYPGIPCFLLGHSMGGLIASRLQLEQPEQFSGLILSAPALAVAEPPSKMMLWLTRLLSAIAPKMGALQLDASQISRDPAVVQAYLDDPLVCKGKASARLVSELFSNLAEVEQRRGEVQIPVLAMHGEADSMTAAVGSVNFVAGVASVDKQLQLYPELYHEIFNEPERLKVLEDLGVWLDGRID